MVPTTRHVVPMPLFLLSLVACSASAQYNASEDSPCANDSQWEGGHFDWKVGLRDRHGDHVNETGRGQNATFLEARGGQKRDQDSGNVSRPCRPSHPDAKHEKEDAPCVNGSRWTGGDFDRKDGPNDRERGDFNQTHPLGRGAKHEKDGAPCANGSRWEGGDFDWKDGERGDVNQTHPLGRGAKHEKEDAPFANGSRLEGGGFDWKDGLQDREHGDIKQTDPLDIDDRRDGLGASGHGQDATFLSGRADVNLAGSDVERSGGLGGQSATFLGARSDQENGQGSWNGGDQIGMDGIPAAWAVGAAVAALLLCLGACSCCWLRVARMARTPAHGTACVVKADAAVPTGIVLAQLPKDVASV